MSIGVIQPLGGHQALLIVAGRRLPAVLGEAGIRWDKREGDRATPAGLLPLRRVFFRADRVSAPACAVRREALAPTDGWCDDPAHQDYNCLVTLPHPARHERMWRDDALYDLVGELGWNDSPRVPGRGSAIFLHVAPPDGAPTAGCIALAPEALREALAAGLTAIEVPAAEGRG
ncbi:L,D-transpeptidase family protein [Acetobacteraceae bacterium KSS8]|uniref:L,D-transpeptidase family protein n=1 Tax=Endosaccharibacter trunci TaxID=2812733 RepID=A0ABT1W3G4_9PROT|nr:L,D-transpeptidase family protein [Acetobacteraceae bacterium KSS8]